MTTNQIEAAKLKETARSNREKEAETKRSNQRRESQEDQERKRRYTSMALDAALDIGKTVLGKASSDAATAAKVAPAVIAAANDPSWYTVSEQVLRDAANIAVFNPVGTPAPEDMSLARTHFNGVPGTKNEPHRFATSGSMLFNYFNTIGNKTGDYSNADAINVAAQNIYSYVRHANSGSRNYERADYMMYLLMVDSIVQYFAWMRRIYGICMHADVYNKYIPKQLVIDLGVDYDDVISNLSSFRTYINSFVVRSNVLAIPSEFPYYARHAFLCSNIFTDSMDHKHQYYLFNPINFFKWKIDSGNDATMLESVLLNTGSILKFSDIVSFGNALIENIVNYEDIGIMTGDTLKAFGEDKLLKLPEVNESYQTPVVYSTEILDQINNITFAKKEVANIIAQDHGDNKRCIVTTSSDPSYPSYMYSKQNLDIHQDTQNQCIYQNLVLTRAVASLETGESSVALLASNLGSVELNFVSNDTSPARVMTSTRLTNVIVPAGFSQVEGGYEYTYTLDSIGSEVIWNGFVTTFYVGPNGVVTATSTEIYDGISFGIKSNSTVQSVIPYQPQILMGFAGNFDWHPKLYYNLYSKAYIMASAEQYPVIELPMFFANEFWFDRNNNTFVDKEVIKKLHKAALLGEFNVAQMGITPRSNYNVR